MKRAELNSILEFCVKTVGIDAVMASLAELSNNSVSKVSKASKPSNHKVDYASLTEADVPKNSQEWRNVYETIALELGIAIKIDNPVPDKNGVIRRYKVANKADSGKIYNVCPALNRWAYEKHHK